MITKQTSNYTN